MVLHMNHFRLSIVQCRNISELKPMVMKRPLKSSMKMTILSGHRRFYKRSLSILKSICSKKPLRMKPSMQTVLNIKLVSRSLK